MSTQFCIFFALSLIGIPASFAQRDLGPFTDFVEPLKRFGIECILDGGIKGNRETIIDGLQELGSYRGTINSCFRILALEIGENAEEFRRKEYKNKEEETRETVKYYCERVTDATRCLTSYQDLLKKCKKRSEGLAFIDLANEVCKNKGSKIVEFLDAGGIECFSARGGPADQPIQPCLDRKFNDKFKQASQLEKFIVRSSCQATSDLRGCGEDVLKKCKNQRPRQIVEKFLQELKKQSPEAKKCFWK